MRIKHVIGVSLSALALTAPIAYAQDTNAKADTAADQKVEKVVVTAQRRSQDLQEVPVSVSAYPAEKRQTVGIDTLQDYTNYTPGLTYSGSDDRVFIRGIGRQTNTNGSDPGVATYSDGVYDSATASAGISDFFLQRVEVLRGPQGTLYGRNSIGGAINAISKRPTEEFSGEGRVTVGDYGVTNFEGALSGSIVDGLRARAAGAYYRQEDGYFTNVAGGPSEGGAGERRYGELQLEADLRADVDAWVKVFTGSTSLRPRSLNEIDSYDYAPFPTAFIAPGSAFGFTQPGFTQLGNATVNPGIADVREFSTNTTSRARLQDNVGVSSELVWHLPAFDVKYIGGYQTYLFDTVSDELDNTSVTSYTFPLNPIFNTCSFVPGCTPLTVLPSQRFLYVEDKSFYSHELTLNSTGDDPLSWIVGAYYYGDELRQEAHFNAPDQPQLKAPANGPANPLGDFVFAASTLETESYAFFGQVDWAITEQFSLTGGLRYTHDEKDGFEELRVVCFGCVPGLTPDDLGSLTPAIDVAASTASFLPAPGVTTPVTIDPATGIARRGLAGSWSATTGTSGVQWKPVEDTMLFASYSRGYKSGGFNAGGISLFPETDPEHVDAFEVGAKTTLNSTLQLNAAAFHYTYEGLQIPLTVEENGINITRFFNLDGSISYGFEAEALWQATDVLQFMLSYGYGDSRIEEACCFVDGADPLAAQPGAQPEGPIVGGQQPQSLVGERLPRIPRHKLALNAQYDFVFDAGRLTLSGSYIWKDETYHVVFNRDYNLAPAYDQVDLRALWTDAEDRYRVIAYVKNLFDEEGYDGALGTLLASPPAAANSVARQVSLTPPRTLGLQLSYRF